MSGVELVLGVFLGSSFAVLVTALRIVLVRRVDRRRVQSPVPPSAEVLEAEHDRLPDARPTPSPRRNP